MSERRIQTKDSTPVNPLAVRIMSQLFFDNAVYSDYYRNGHPRLFRNSINYQEFKLASLLKSMGQDYKPQRFPLNPAIQAAALEIEQRVDDDHTTFVPPKKHIWWIDPYDDHPAIFSYLREVVTGIPGFSGYGADLQYLMGRYATYQIPEDEILDLSARYQVSRDIVLGYRGERGNLVTGGKVENEVTGRSDFPVCALELQVSPAIVKLNQKGYFTWGSSGYGDSVQGITENGENAQFHQISIPELLGDPAREIIESIDGLDYYCRYPTNRFLYVVSGTRTLREIRELFNQAAEKLPPINTSSQIGNSKM